MACWDDIQGYACEIGAKFSPNSIVLLGSHAKGDAGPDSDVDLLVVMDYQGKPSQFTLSQHPIRTPQHDQG